MFTRKASAAAQKPNEWCRLRRAWAGGLARTWSDSAVVAEVMKWISSYGADSGRTAIPPFNLSYCCYAVQRRLCMTIINLEHEVELRHFEHFVAVAEEGSFTRAAARVHLVQSA